MSLVSLYEKHPDELSGYRVEQIVALAGEGRLRDGSECSTELRAFFRKIDLNRLDAFIHETLSEKFTDSGFVLQDLVNELGRRLSFDVQNGRYHGVANQPGHDGYWESSEARFIVEIKTTDAYRINLSTIASYAMKLKLQEPKENPKPLGLLIVVGRQDTGDLEAQIRGSKYAWDVRLISAESLIDLVRLHGVAMDAETEKALRHSLMPVEYTRVDHLVALLSKVAYDVDRSNQVQDTVNDIPSGLNFKHNLTAQSNFEARPIEVVRNKIIESLAKGYGGKYERLSRSLIIFESGHKTIVSVSKRYIRNDQHYWYALQDSWLKILNGNDATLCLGMTDLNYYLLIPSKVAQNLPSLLNKTEKENSTYWHIGLLEDKGLARMSLPRSSEFLDMTEYKVSL